MPAETPAAVMTLFPAPGVHELQAAAHSGMAILARRVRAAG
ncbi:hypothetical protein SRB17_82510 [Streptomyces sp. RB17]|nr:hypothetical protein [Streptomyces sp. RB17]